MSSQYQYGFRAVTCKICEGFVEDCTCDNWLLKITALYQQDYITLDMFYAMLHYQIITRNNINVHLN